VAAERRKETPDLCDDDCASDTAEDTRTLVPAFDVEAFARASETLPKQAATLDDALKSYLDDVSDDAPLAELGTAEFDLTPYEERGQADEAAIPRLRSLSRVPVVLPRSDALVGMISDHREAFVVSLIDGVSSLEAIVDISGMPPDDAVQLVADLVGRGVLGLKDDL
jgi:hypothetical protein